MGINEGTGVGETGPQTLGEYVKRDELPHPSAIFHSRRGPQRRPTYRVKRIRKDESGKPYLVKVVPVDEKGRQTERELSFSLSLHSEDRRQAELS